MNELVERLTNGVGIVRETALHHLPADFWPDPDLTAAGAILAGLVLALWGARVLRGVYVIAFMGAGAAIGIKLARMMGVDDLVGLVLGAGLAGLAGHLLYHWWVGMSAGVGAMVLVLVVAGVKYMPEIEAELETGVFAFKDQARGVGTDDFALALAPPATPQSRDQALRDYLSGVATHYWATRRDQAYRVGFVLALSWMTGLGMGLTLPRFTTVIGTSVIGVLSLALGLSLLIATHSPSLWGALVGHAAWSLAALGGLLCVSVLRQARRGRPVMAAPAPARRPVSSVVAVAHT